MEERRSDEELIGRADLDDIEAILAITNTDTDAPFHDVGATVDVPPPDGAGRSTVNFPAVTGPSLTRETCMCAPNSPV